MRMAAIQTEAVSVLRAPRMRVLMGLPLPFHANMHGTGVGLKCIYSRNAPGLISGPTMRIPVAAVPRHGLTLENDFLSRGP
jgi:hypothetical protein